MSRVVQTTFPKNWLKIMLNKPRSLNAVDTEVAQTGIFDLAENVLRPEIKGVIATGAGRAVAAGGDIRFMVNNVKAGKNIGNSFKSLGIGYHANTFIRFFNSDKLHPTPFIRSPL